MSCCGGRTCDFDENDHIALDTSATAGCCSNRAVLCPATIGAESESRPVQGQASSTDFAVNRHCSLPRPIHGPQHYLNAASAVVGTASTRREQVDATSRSALDAFASTTIAPGDALAGGGSSSSSTAARSACASASSGGLAHRKHS